MVILLLMMSAALLNATRRQMDASLSLVLDEKLYLQQASLAVSALAWGKTLRWAAASEWRCRTRAATGWQACFKITTKGEALLRGDSGSDTLALYQWVTRNERNGMLHPIPHGCIDFCPLAKEQECLPAETAGL
ncbi:DUF2509 family protein [Kalamiella sp. sgz302252]|uniref:DUF2509 family protein n=1 Tax=Pantoea sp. sgz302252 TaxID=3341827 RepID=UPI0036D333A5